MTAMLRFSLLAALVAASIPAMAEGQGSSADSLVRRIVVLERQVAGLEQRVQELEARAKVEPSRDRPAKATANWNDLTNWRRLERGMTMDEVRALLGEPERVDAVSISTTWRWGKFPANDAEVQFIEGKVAGWSEPRR